MTQQLRIGIDLGGTKIECIALDARSGQELFRKRVATPRDDYQGCIEAIKALALEAETATSMSGTVGVGIPGTLSAVTGRVKNANSVWLNGQDLKADLTHALSRTVRISNDANCFAVSEAVDGAGKDQQVVFGVILGTGVGAGIAINRGAWGGANGVAGEWGHNPLPRASQAELAQQVDCYCGQQGCIETWLAGPSFARLYQQSHGGERLSPPQIVAMAEASNEAAKLALEEYCARLAKALGHVVNVLDPSIIVLGGGMSNIAAIYPRVNQLLSDWVFGGECATRVVANIHGDSSGVRGAAWLWNS